MKETWAIGGVDLHLDLRGSRVRRALETALRDAVRRGRLGPGTRLPSSRSLAADLGLARNTVAGAYAQLVAEGWLEARQGSGTMVTRRSSAPALSGPPRAPEPGRARFDLRPGVPELSSFPRAAWLTAARRALRGASDEALGYGDPRGALPLRRALAEYLARARGVEVSPDRVVICAGFGQGIGLLGRALRTRGIEALALEAYGHPEHRDSITATGLRPRPVSVDRGGAVVDEFGDAGAALLTPAHQFPLGPALTPQRRVQAVEWARARGALIIEDDYDGEFRYDRRPLGAMQALAPELVVYAGTASKSLAPGLRLGWLVLPQALLEETLAARRLTDGPGTLEQLTLAELITTGGYDRHVRRVRLLYRRRRDRLVTALARRAPLARVTGIDAGLHAVVELGPEQAEDDVLARARERGLILAGLGAYRVGAQEHPPALVVGYGTPPEHAFSTSVARLCAVLADAGPG